MEGRMEEDMQCAHVNYPRRHYFGFLVWGLFAGARSALWEGHFAANMPSEPLGSNP